MRGDRTPRLVRMVLATLGGRGVVTFDLPADRLSAQVVATYLVLKGRGRI